MALSANQPRVYDFESKPVLNAIPVKASSVIYAGSAVGDKTSAGYCTALAAGDPFLGFAVEAVTGGSTDGSSVATVRRKGTVKIPVTGVAGVTDIGSQVFASDDNTFTLTSTGNSPIGSITEFVTGTTVKVAFESSTDKVTKRVAGGVVALTDAATVNTDASLGNTFTITLGGNRTFAAPTNGIDGQKVIYAIKQDGTGSRTVTWNAAYRFSGGTAPTLTTTASKIDYVGFVYNATDSKYDCLASTLNF